MEPAASVRPGGIALLVRATPGAAREAVTGAAVDAAGRQHLKLAVRARPRAGAANAAVVALLAAAFDVPKSGVEILRGATGRLKRVAIDGDPAVLMARAMALLAAPAHDGGG